MLPDIHRATQKFYIFLIVYLTGCTPVSGQGGCKGDSDYCDDSKCIHGGQAKSKRSRNE